MKIPLGSLCRISEPFGGHLPRMMAEGKHVYLDILQILAAESDFDIQPLSTC